MKTVITKEDGTTEEQETTESRSLPHIMVPKECTTVVSIEDEDEDEDEDEATPFDMGHLLNALKDCSKVHGVTDTVGLVLGVLAHAELAVTAEHDLVHGGRIWIVNHTDENPEETTGDMLRERNRDAAQALREYADMLDKCADDDALIKRTLEKRRGLAPN